jgi:hypothetical protein
MQAGDKRDDVEAACAGPVILEIAVTDGDLPN